MVEDPAAARPFAVGFSFSHRAFPPPPQIPRATNLDSNREGDETMPDSLGVRVSNGIVLLITIVLLTGPIWYFIPRSLMPLASPLGKFRFVIGVILCHAGLVFWPFVVVLCWNLLRRKQWIEWLKLAALFAFCLWQALESTQGVIRIWTRLYHWLAYLYNG